MWKDPMMVYAWRSDRRVCLMIGPRSNGVWKMWQGHGEWHQVWSKSNQEAVNDLIIPKQAAAMPLAFAHHQAINNYGEGLLIRFLSGCNEEILITASHNPTIVFTGDKTFSATIPSRCPLYIPTQE
ncbi:hypothetical protein Pelo_5417 [Pelomyxa schiedti]|nr:hypothetical protein Pelo_5417 [Pelomyxa schiedti]